MKSIPTVLIETENGPVRINETDFDEATMTLAGSEPEDDPVTDETPPAETPPAHGTDSGLNEDITRLGVDNGNILDLAVRPDYELDLHEPFQAALPGP